MKPITNLFAAGLLLIALQVSGQPIVTTFSPSTASGAVGSSFDLQLKVTNFKDIISLQLPITFNASVLQYESSGDYALPGFTAANVNGLSGQVRISWFADQGQYPNGFTLTDNSVLLRLRFKVLTNGTTPLNVANVAPGIEIINKNNTTVTVSYQNGATTVTGGQGGPPPITGFHISANGNSVQTGQTYCLPVTVNDYTNMITTQYAMHWNPAILQYQNTQAYNLPDLTNSSFGGNTAGGTLLFAWTDPAATGVTRANGTKIYEVCFKAIGAANTSSMVTIDGVGFPPGSGSAEAFNASSQNLWTNAVPINDTVFVVAAPPPPPPANATTFTADKDTVGPGQQTCVDVKVKNFNSIVSMQYAMTYDKTKFTFQNIQFGSNPLTLNAGSNFNTATAGLIKFSWLDPNTTGVTLPDNTTIYSVCFTATGTAGMNSDFTFGSTAGLPIEITNPSGEIIPAFNNGSIVISDILPPNATAAIQNAKCFNGNDGSIALTVTGAAPFTYSWSGPPGFPGATTKDISALKAGNYTVTITASAGGSVVKGPFAVGQPSSAVSVPTGQVQIVGTKCNGGSDGSINITTTGGTAPYTWNWSGPTPFTANTEDISGLKAGLYNLTVTDANGCSIINQPLSVSQPSAINLSSTASSNVKCFGASDGSIQINLGGGTTPFDFKWYNGGGTGALVSTAQNPNNLPVGSYNVVATDVNGCSKSLSNPVSVSGPPNALNVGIAKTDLVCGGTNTGTITLSPTGGWPGNYSVNWSNPQPGLGGLAPTGVAGGAYNGTVTDAGNCAFPVSVVVNAPAAISIGSPTVQDVTCFAQGNGSINITPAGGNGAPYAVTWTGPSGTISGTSISALGPGFYTPTISDKNNCTATLSPIEVKSPSALVVSMDSTIIQKGLTDNGKVYITVNGGTSPYTYDWNNNGPQVPDTDPQDLINVAAGTYVVTVTDANGCQTIQTYIVESDNPLLPSTASVEDACDNDGCVNLNIAPQAQGPFVITWNNGNNTKITASYQESVCGLAPGIYDFTITDAANHNFTIENLNVKQLEKAIVGSSFVDPNQDFKNGSITLTNPNNYFLTYKWSTNSTLPVVFNLDEGTYTVTVTNQTSQCTAVYTFNLAQQWPALVASNGPTATNPNCLGDKNGSISISISGGKPNYTYKWSGPNGFNKVTANISDLEAGAYNLTVTDARNTTITFGPITLTAQSALAITNVNELSNYNGWQVSGDNICDGKASVVVNNSGVAPISFLWSNGATTAVTDTLCGGAYSVTATDQLGCTSVWEGELTAPPGIALNSQISQPINCYGECNGRIRLFVNGGIVPYNVHWSTGQIDDLLSTNSVSEALNLCAGDYTVTVTDGNDVKKEFTVSLTQPDPLVIEFSKITPTAFTVCDGEIIAQVPGGVPPLEFNWSSLTRPGYNGDGQRAENLCSGEVVEFIVVDKNGCIAQAQDTVSYRPEDCLQVRPVLTPGEQDGKNDFLLITCIEQVSNSVEIYNRWGQLVYQEDNYDNSGVRWDGTQKGQPLPDGVYYYVINYVDVNGIAQQLKGHINLLR